MEKIRDAHQRISNFYSFMEYGLISSNCYHLLVAEI